DRLAVVTEEYLRYARLPKPQLVRANLNEAVRDLLDFVRPELTSAGISLEQRLAGDLPEVVADVGQVRQLLLNLIRNAREAMPGGGAVFVGTRFRERDAFERSRPQERPRERPAGGHRRARPSTRRHARRLRTRRLAARGCREERRLPLPRAPLLPGERRLPRRTAPQFGRGRRGGEPERRHHPRQRILLHAGTPGATTDPIRRSRRHARAATH